MNSSTFIYVGLTILFFGFWGTFIKIGQERLGSMNHLILMGITLLPITILGILLYRSSFPTISSGYIFTIFGAIYTARGMYFFTTAIWHSENNIIGVIALSALYPGVTAFLAS